MFKYLLIVLCCAPVFCKGQGNAVYYVVDGVITQDKSRATFFRLPMVKEGEKYKVTDYFMDGSVRAEAYSLSPDSAIYDGYYTEYYNNGRKRMYGNYVKGNRVGQWKLKYEDTDGVWSVINYYPDTKDTTDDLSSFYRSGKQKRKQWTVHDKETGQCFAEDGREIPFTPFEKMPEFKGNKKEFLSKLLRYPDEAMEKNIQGTVYVQFIVNEDGSIETKNVSGPHMSLCQEALRVVKLMPKWSPGLRDDKPVKVYYALAVLFRLEW